MRIGAHIPNERPLVEAAARGADLIQMFLSNPQSWKKPNPRRDAEELRQAPVPIYVHAPYLVNVVAEPSRIRIPSRKILQETCDAAAGIGAVAVIVHGGHVDAAEAVEAAFPRWRKALQTVVTEVPIFIENTAGGDNAVVRRLDSTARLWEHIGDLEPGFVLDTCHAWAGGEPFEDLIDRIKATTGRIDLVQCNDSKDPPDSRRDRHANLGEGQIPPELLAEVVREAGAPVVVETPGGVQEQSADIRWLRQRL